MSHNIEVLHVDLYHQHVQKLAGKPNRYRTVSVHDDAPAYNLYDILNLLVDRLVEAVELVNDSSLSPLRSPSTLSSSLRNFRALKQYRKKLMEELMTIPSFATENASLTIRMSALKKKQQENVTKLYSI